MYRTYFGIGADDEVRTRDILIGSQVLYQLSYIRICLLVPKVGLEPTCREAGDSESPVSTSFTTWAIYI